MHLELDVPERGIWSFEDAHRYSCHFNEKGDRSPLGLRAVNQLFLGRTFLAFELAGDVVVIRWGALGGDRGALDERFND